MKIERGSFTTLEPMLIVVSGNGDRAMQPTPRPLRLLPDRRWVGVTYKSRVWAVVPCMDGRAALLERAAELETFETRECPLAGPSDLPQFDLGNCRFPNQLPRTVQRHLIHYTSFGTDIETIHALPN